MLLRICLRDNTTMVIDWEGTFHDMSVALNNNKFIGVKNANNHKHILVSTNNISTVMETSRENN